MSSIRELKKLRNADCSAFDAEQGPGGDHSSLPSPPEHSPARSSRDVLPTVLHEDRMYYWERMSSLVRLQRWWKKIHAIRTIHAKAVQRRKELAEMYETECAATIQTAWRRFHQQKEGADD